MNLEVSLFDKHKLLSGWIYFGVSISFILTKIGLKFPHTTVQKKGYMDLQEVSREENISCSYGATLQKDPSCALPCSWGSADPSSFLIRGPSYLQDRQKVIVCFSAPPNIEKKPKNLKYKAIP